MRLFIAIDFNELKDYFVQLQSLLPKNAKLSFTKTFHITLKFLGEVQPIVAENLIDILKKVDFKSFPVWLDSAGVFPNESYIRVVWLSLKPEDKILGLQRDVDDSLKEFFKKEKEFKSHITLARVKSIEDKKIFVEQLKKIKIENKKTEVKQFSLVKSTLTPNGPVYEDLEVFKGG